jgi:hypothetical protein
VNAAALHYQFGGDGLVMRDTSITGNTVAATSGVEEWQSAGGILEADGHALLQHVTISGNTQTLRTTNGPALLGGAVVLCECGNGDGGVVDFNGVVISGNSSTATSQVGPAEVRGGGIFDLDGANLTLRASTVSHNTAVATALADPSSSLVRGGGVWVGQVAWWLPEPVTDLAGSAVTHNAGVVPPGGSVQGAGLWHGTPVAGTSGVRHNVPNDIAP